MVNENEVLNYLDGQAKPPEQTKKQPEISIDDIVAKVADKLYPYLTSTIAVLHHIVNYNNLKDKYPELKPEDYIKYHDEIEKELGEFKADKIEDILNRVSLKKEKFHNRFNKPKEEVSKKVVVGVDVSTNGGVVQGTEAVQKPEEKKDDVRKIFERLTKGKSFGGK